MVASPPGSNPRAGGPPSSRVAQFLNHGRNVWLVRLSPHLPRPGRDDRGAAAPAPPRARSIPPRAHNRTKIPEAQGDFGEVVAPTGVDPVTFRFSVERSTN